MSSYPKAFLSDFLIFKITILNYSCVSGETRKVTHSIASSGWRGENMNRNYLRKTFELGRPKLCGKIAYPLHDHDFGEIFWMDKGRCLHVVNGIAQDLDEGDLLFVRPSDAHSFHSIGNKSFWLVNIAFHWGQFLSLKGRYFAGDAEIYGEKSRLPKLLKMNARTRLWAEQAFTELVKAPRSVFFIERFLMNLFAEFGLVREPDGFFDQATPRWLLEAWQGMSDPLRLEEGAAGLFRLCGKSEGHVSREFRKHTGKTVVDAVNELRMEHAAALLAGTSRDILEIAMDCGFQSLSGFYHSFRSCHGVTPRQFRQNAAGFINSFGNGEASPTK